MTSISFVGTGGRPLTLMSPSAFVRRPHRWLKELHATDEDDEVFSAATNFAYGPAGRRRETLLRNGGGNSIRLGPAGREPRRNRIRRSGSARRRPFGPGAYRCRIRCRPGQLRIYGPFTMGGDRQSGYRRRATRRHGRRNLAARRQYRQRISESPGGIGPHIRQHAHRGIAPGERRRGVPRMEHGRGQVISAAPSPGRRSPGNPLRPSFVGSAHGGDRADAGPQHLESFPGR